MGGTMWIEVKGRSIKETSRDCSTLHRMIEELEPLALRLDVRALNGFVEWGEMAAEALREYLADSEGKPSEDVQKAVRWQEVEGWNHSLQSVEERAAIGSWFDASEGLRSVRGIRRALEEDPRVVSWPARYGDHVEQHRQQLLDDLSHCEGVLQAAAASGQAFRLLLVS